MKSYLPFLVFTTLFILSGILYYQVVTSPFNTNRSTLLAPSPWSMFQITTLLLLASLGYWFLVKSNLRNSLLLFFLHLISTIPFLLLIHYQTNFIDTSHTNLEIINTETSDSGALSSIRLLNITGYMFLISQLLFLAYVSWQLILKKRRLRNEKV